MLENCFVIKTKSWIYLLKEILIMLNKDRLVTITNCMMHFLSYQTVLFLLIFYVGEGTLCVCIYVCWLSNRLVETYFYRNESVIEKAI